MCCMLVEEERVHTKKARAEVVTGSNLHACATSQSTYAHHLCTGGLSRCAQVRDLCLSVAML